MQGSYLTARGPNNKIKVEVDNAIHFIDIAEVHKTKQQKVKTVSENFRERLAAYKKDITKDMTFADQLDMRDPQFVTEFTADIYDNMRKQEETFKL